MNSNLCKAAVILLLAVLTYQQAESTLEDVSLEKLQAEIDG